MTTGPVRVVVVGAGGIAGAYAELLRETDGACAVGVADVRLDAAVAWAGAAGDGVEATSQADRLLDLGPEVAVICTPPVSHEELATMFLEAGVAVLCEKPLALDVRSARELSAVARRTGVPLGMAAKFRFCADVRAARDLLATEALGALRLVENVFTSRVDMALRWNSRRSMSGGGVIIDNGTHSIDLLHFLGLEVGEVLATEQARPVGFEVEDSARLQLVSTSGVDVTIDLSWSIDRSAVDFLRLYGSEGEVRVGWRGSSWRRFGSDWQPLGSGYDKGSAMGGALTQFCAAARGDEEPEVDADAAVQVAAVVDAAYRSLAERRWVELEAEPPA